MLNFRLTADKNKLFKFASIFCSSSKCIEIVATNCYILAKYLSIKKNSPA